MKKLTYKKYKDLESILFINLHNDYTIIAIKAYDKLKGCYNVQLRIKEDTVEKWDLMEKAENIEICANYKSINSAILKKVANLFEEGFFDYYIQRYEYELKCFDKGNEIMEKERLEGK